MEDDFLKGRGRQKDATDDSPTDSHGVGQNDQVRVGLTSPTHSQSANRTASAVVVDNAIYEWVEEPGAANPGSLPSEFLGPTFRQSEL